ncbi:MAG: NUDIX domain-containing protein [Lewinella sp.]|nr:NUDIX domain-containing protein [Lewinella sp.]
MTSYLQRIRAKLGPAPFIHPAARIIVENEDRKILMIERVDNGRLGLPAGALESGETIEQCIIREVREETGLIIRAPTVIGISSHPDREFVTYPNGDQIQYFTVEFYANQWEGLIKGWDAAEVSRVQFREATAIALLPDNERAAFASLDFYRLSGSIMLK